MKTKHQFARGIALLVLVSTLNLQPSTALAQGTAFTYQGRLNSGGNPANGNYDLRFSLWTDVSGGSSVTGFVTNSPVAASNGLFTTTIDFGPDVFDGSPLWLQIGVRTNGASGGYNSLSPRQQLTPAPYAIMASSASNLLGNLPVAQVSGTVPLAQIPAAVVTNNETGVSISGTFTGNGAGVANVNAATLNGFNATNFWQLDGNNVTAGSFLGSTNNQPVEIRVNNTRALRLESTTATASYSNIVNVIGGSPNNSIASGVYGSVIAGGGGYYGGAASSNTIAADMSFLGGGQGNSVQPGADHSFLGGGYNNYIETNAYDSFVGGGAWNSVQPGASYSVVVGGQNNFIQTNSDHSFLGGGENNSIQPSADHSCLVGGQRNIIQTNSEYCFLGGGSGNAIETVSRYSFLGGGELNSIQKYNYNAFLGGGYNNSIQPDADMSVIVGGMGNSIQTNAYYSVLGGGYGNSIQPNAIEAFLGGGGGNVVSGVGAVVAGGGYDGNSVRGNTASGPASTVSGGTQNTASAPGSTVGGGDYNIATNSNATVPGGQYNIAGGYHSFAAGATARALHNGSFVWNCDYNPIASSADFQFTARALGGFVFITSGTSVGASLAPGATAWSVLSDRNAKKDFAAISPVEILDKLAAMPITQWHYQWESADATPHIGPMAQDFKAAFYPGRDDKSITTLEADGVELAAIQGLNEKLESGKRKAETQIEELKAENVELRNANQFLEQRLEKLERLLEQKSR